MLLLHHELLLLLLLLHGLCLLCQNLCRWCSCRTGK
jgi:hypothetical protein